MDWAKAKNILIVAFLLINIFLAFNLYINGNQHLNISDSQINDVIRILDDKGVKVNVNIPRDTIAQQILTVEYKEFNPQHLASGVFGTLDLQHTEQNDTVIFSDNQRKLKIKSNREVAYVDLSLSDVSVSNFNEKEAVNAGTDFLKTTGLYNSSMVIGQVSPTQRGYDITYMHKYKNTFLEISCVQLEVTPEGIYSLNMLWLQPKKVQKIRKEIIPATQALLKVVSSEEILEAVPVVIQDIKLIYYFNWKDAKEGEAFPSWKIETDGKNYYINALTGQFDK